MKNQSKNLLQYLADNDLLHASDEAIALGKIIYRREYKKNWRKNLKKSKELRPSFTPSEFNEVGIRAKLYGLNATAFARDAILSTLKDVDLIPNREQLVHVLAAISMSEISLGKNSNPKEVQALLLQAEEMLLKYLNMQGR